MNQYKSYVFEGGLYYCFSSLSIPISILNIIDLSLKIQLNDKLINAKYGVIHPNYPNDIFNFYTTSINQINDLGPSFENSIINDLSKKSSCELFSDLFLKIKLNHLVSMLMIICFLMSNYFYQKI